MFLFSLQRKYYENTMREYIHTKEGQALGVSTGLESIVTTLHQDSVTDYPVAVELATSSSYSSLSDEAAMDDEMSIMRNRLVTHDDLKVFDRARALDPDLERDNWRYMGGDDELALYPTPSLQVLAPASVEDRLILSGTVGLSLTAFESESPLLSRDRYSEYGFSTFTESCAFVGSYVVTRLMSLEKGKGHFPPHRFEFKRDGLVHSMKVDGSSHGDFVLSDRTRTPDHAISPINTITEFSPENEVLVRGYHSVEPHVVAALIEDKYIKNGKEGALHFIEQCYTLLNDFAKSTPSQEFPFNLYADYGTADSSLIPFLLETFVSGALHHVAGRALYSTVVDPFSPDRFEIIPTEQGVRFQNRDSHQLAPSSVIEVDQEQYGDLFHSLLMQGYQGLGRTSPVQLYEVLKNARKILEEHSPSPR